MSKSPRVVIVKTYREVVALLAVCSITLAGGMLLRCRFGCAGEATPALTTVVNIGMALALLGISIYLFGIAIRQPIALRMDEDGISGYYAPPLTWSQIADFGVYRDRSEGTFIPTTYIGIRVARTGALYAAQTPRQRSTTASLFRKSDYHILIPQIMLKDFSAGRVVSAAKALQVFSKKADPK
ncbi:hypothetical protein [Sulfitobacter sp.]|uniref:hypothetical protein n=1 Tax=Sulfitobacter sp. TaxID=1903071 RepID=UPI003002B5F3